VLILDCVCIPGAPGYPAAAAGTVDYLAAAGMAAQYPPGAAALAMAAAAAAGQSPPGMTTGLLDRPSSSSGHCEY